LYVTWPPDEGREVTTMQQTTEHVFPEEFSVELGVQLGDVTELTLGEGTGTSEDKRYQYN
jgi:hypothetical protein